MDFREDKIRAQFMGGAVEMARTERFGHEVGSEYCDLFWTPILGAGVMALLRWARWRLPVNGIHSVPVEEICEALGRMAPGKACSVVTRAVSFHAADLVEVGPAGVAVVAVRSSLIGLSDQRVEQLSPGLRRAHANLVGVR